MRVLGVTLIVVACFGQGFAQDPSQPDPCKTKHRVVADETHCDRYWECVNGQPQLYDCPNGLVFIGRNRGIAEGCDYPWRTHTCGRKALANAPIATEHCEWLYGIFGHETSCTRYWTCWNGTATEQFCIGGLLYSEETHACDWPQNVAGCQKHPLCKDDPNANVPLGKSCERYWACQGGYPRLQRCPATLVFNRESRRCVNPPTVDCDVPSTTAPPLRPQAGRQGVNNQQFNDQSPASQQPRVQARRPQLSQRRQQEQLQPQEQEAPIREQFVDEQSGPAFEAPLNEQFVDQPNEQAFEAPAPEEIRSQPSRSQRPRPNFSSAQLPFIPAGATPINLNNRSPRLPPIPGAIPIRFN